LLKLKNGAYLLAKSKSKKILLKIWGDEKLNKSDLYNVFKRKIIILMTILFPTISIMIVNCGGGGGGGGGDSGSHISAPGLQTYSISGRVTLEGLGLSNVTISLMAASSAATTKTDSNGFFQFSNLPGGIYTASASKLGYVFSPSSRTIDLSNNNFTSQDFVAEEVKWAKTYGGANSEIGYSIKQTSDEGFIIAGHTNSFGVIDTDLWILKIDAIGSIEWQKTYGGNNYDFGRSILETPDGGFIIAGETSSFSADTDLWILKVDTNGNILWQKSYGGVGTDKAYCIQMTSDNGLIVAGETSSFNSQGADAWIIKLNSVGDVVWQKAYGGDKNDVAYYVQQISDRGYLVIGKTNSFSSSGDYDFWVMKLDANGDLEWHKTYGGPNDDVAYSGYQTSDNGYIVAGKYTPSGTIFSNIWVIKLNASGDIEWQKMYGDYNDDVAFSITQTSDYGSIVAGKSTSFGNILGDGLLLKLDFKGDIEWSKIYEGNNSNSLNFAQQIAHGGYILIGETASYGVGRDDVWVLKLDKNGNIGGSCALVNSANILSYTSPYTVQNLPLIQANITNATVTNTSAVVQNSRSTVNSQCYYP